MATTRLHWHVQAPKATVYRLILDADAVRQWMVPTGMTSEVHEFDAREGGAFRISLTYDNPTEAGKTTAQTDTFHGRFARLVPDEEVVQLVEFETDDPTVTGEQTITYALSDADGGTDIAAAHEGLPDGVSAEDNEIGWRMSLTKLAALAENRAVD
ncbi:SRPBCC family protein [Nocardia altamirensis]|uniref:SRPBCC family protein n=1 Tax=Nocardia altamirensis TaxID=472158 RepID=UPI0008402DAE|nr:SRPBCC family protein [Nocardia altamirensis]